MLLLVVSTCPTVRTLPYPRLWRKSVMGWRSMLNYSKDGYGHTVNVNSPDIDLQSWARDNFFASLRQLGSDRTLTTLVHSTTHTHNTTFPYKTFNTRMQINIFIQKNTRIQQNTTQHSHSTPIQNNTNPQHITHTQQNKTVPYKTSLYNPLRKS